MSARAASAPGAGVLDRLQVLRSAPTPLRGAPAATWTPSPRTGVGPLRVPGPGLQPSSHDTTTTRTDPAGSTLARPDFGPKDGVHLTRRIGLQHAKQGGDDVPSLQGHPWLSDASEGTRVPESRGEVGVQDPQHHDGARDTRWRDDLDDRQAESERLSAQNGVMHQGNAEPASAANPC